MHGRVSYQSSGTHAKISTGFIRKVRNFMNNWETHGCTFKFDGYRAVLRIDPQVGGGGAAPTRAFFPPPWWPTGTYVDKEIPPGQEEPVDVPPYFRVRIEPATINNIIPRLVWSNEDTVIGSPTLEGDILVAPNQRGIFYAECKFLNGIVNEVTLKMSYSVELPEDTSSVFHILTHFFQTESDKIYVSPMYRNSIRAILCDEEWRWS